MERKVTPEAVYHFDIDDIPVSASKYGEGHINTTYIVKTKSGRNYILQKIKDSTFDVPVLMKNIAAVIRLAEENTTDERESMHLVSTLDGDSYYQDDTGFYRMYHMIEDSICLQSPQGPEDFYQSAVAFGKFQKMMDGFPVDELCEIIPDFHNTINRYRLFKEAVQKDPLNRVKDVLCEIDFVLKREEEAGTLQRMRESGELPVRVTHNDTKLNNVLLDEKTHKALCVIDLDTVMPGLAAYDFGDSIRFGASTALEDEKDLDKVSLDLDLFRIFTKGFIENGPAFSKAEIDSFALGAKIMTLECGMRFLTDHIEGDNYFSIGRPGHNLDRARTQFKLVADMENKWDKMLSIVNEVYEDAKI